MEESVSIDKLTEIGQKETVNRLASLNETIDQIQNLINPKLSNL